MEKPTQEFKDKLYQAFEALIDSQEHQELMEYFKGTYEFKATFPWLLESGRFGNGLARALDCIANDIFHTTPGSYFRTFEDIERKVIDHEFKSKFLGAVREFLNDDFHSGFIKSRFDHRNVDVDKLTRGELLGYLANGINVYHLRARSGCGLDAGPW